VTKATAKHIEIAPGRRIIAVSDIHGNLAYFKGLLEKLRFCADDVLIIVGDFLEKGEESLKTLRFIMEMSKSFEVHTICGNWTEVLDNAQSFRIREYANHYLRARPQALLCQMCREAGYDPFENGTIDFAALCARLSSNFRPELDFLRSLPTMVETSRHIFVHGGLPEGKREDWTAYDCMKNDEFMKCGRRFSKWIIVGHWPVVLYHESIVNANPIINRESKIISIDGGCVLKDDGQLNALIIPSVESDDFKADYYDSFPVLAASSAQRESTSSYYIRYGDSRVKVLEHGAEFCCCRHERTGYEMDILTKYLRRDAAGTFVNDCTDHILEVSPGDLLSVVEKTSRGYFVKRNGVSGWYYGQF